MFSRAIELIRRRLFDRCVLRPSRMPIDHGDQIRRQFAVGKFDTEAFCRSNVNGAADSDRDLLIVKFPGTAGRAERSTEFPMSCLPLKDTRADLWTWNPPGYGGSSGRASLQNIANASIGLCRTLIEQSNANRVWLIGNSLGCATAMNVAANLDFEDRSVGLMLRNPPPLKPVFCAVAKRYLFGSLAFPWAETLVEEMDVMKTAVRIKHSAVFIHCELDRLVPIDLQRQVVERYLGAKRSVVLDGLGHGGVANENHFPLIDEAVHWLWEQP